MLQGALGFFEFHADTVQRSQKPSNVRFRPIADIRPPGHNLIFGSNKVRIMTSISGAVYDPPRQGLPILAVVFGADGDVLIARSMASRNEAETLLAQVQSKVQAQIDQAQGGE